MNNCKTCGRPCERQWCSQLCHIKSRRIGTDFTCVNCSRSFYLRPAEIRKGGGKYCSNSCRRAYEAAHTKEYLKIGRTPIHRIVAAEKLGRPLWRGEVVHHIDGDRHNNHPDNLIVLPSQAAHARLEGFFENIPLDQRIRNGQRSGEVRRAKRQAKR